MPLFPPLQKSLETRDSSLASRISGLYTIADGAWNPRASLAELAEELLRGGCRLIQLRMKDQKRERVAEEAGRIARLKRVYDFTFLVNDHAEVAVEVGADGVHVGEGDLPVRELKRRHGGGLIVGYSSHSIEEAKRAEAEGADYVAFGAIFPTATKGPGHPVQGIGKLREVVLTIDVPVVAIGGIGRENIDQVIAVGPAAAAMIRALAMAPDIAAEARWFVERWARPTPADGGSPP